MTTKRFPERTDELVFEADNRLLLEEVRMIERYTVAIRKAPQEDMVEGLLKARRAHEWAAGSLRTYLLEMGSPSWRKACRWETLSAGCRISEERGEDGAFSLADLRNGEERCFERYTAVLAWDDAPQAFKELVRVELLPVPLRNLEILRCVQALRELRFNRSPFGQRRW